jgi:8-oxo-dGTP pyrophosphatase MutT (NUDIX family)
VTSKVFVYITRRHSQIIELLVMDSLHEPGFEVPKGSLEPGETPEQAVHREVYEEAGICGLRILAKLGEIQWRGEDQAFYLGEAPPDVPDVFVHQVHGTGIDRGFWYAYRWIPVGTGLEERLVQGCDRFVDELVAAVGMLWET